MSYLSTHTCLLPCLYTDMTQVGQYTSMVVIRHVCVERYDTGRSVYKHGSRHVCVERYDTGRSVYKHGSRHVCVERYDTGRNHLMVSHLKLVAAGQKIGPSQLSLLQRLARSKKKHVED